MLSCAVVSTIALGALAVPVLGLCFWDSNPAIIAVFNVLGALRVAPDSTCAKSDHATTCRRIH